MTKKTQTPQETAADIKHAVNVLITRARDGEYSSAASEKLYRTFEKELDALTRAAGRAADASGLEKDQAAMIEMLRLAVEQNCSQIVRLHGALTAASEYCGLTTGEPPEGAATWWEWWTREDDAEAPACPASKQEAGIDV